MLRQHQIVYSGFVLPRGLSADQKPTGHVGPVATGRAAVGADRSASAAA